jgi:hypothetical protein
VNDAANDGQTPIYLAARGRPKMVEYLLAHGADPNATTRDGRTPLMHAVKTGWLTVVKPALIDGYREVFEALLARGADVNRRDSSGTTALMEAAANGDAETVELLLSHGADPTLRDARGKSAFDIAAKATHGAVVRALVAHDVPLGAKQRIKYALGRLAYALSWIFTPFFILAISVLVAYSRRRIKKPRAPRRTVLSGSDLPPLAKIDCAECGACVPLKLEGMRCPHCKTPTRPPEDYVATLKARAKGAALLVEALAAWRRATLFSSTPVRVFFWAIGFVWLAVIVAGALSDVGRSLFDGHPLLFISALVSAAGLPVFSVSYASYLGDVRKRLPIIPTIGAEVASAAVVDCRSCGAPVEFDAGQLVTSCGYCCKLLIAFCASATGSSALVRQPGNSASDAASSIHLNASSDSAFMKAFSFALRSAWRIGARVPCAARNTGSLYLASKSCWRFRTGSKRVATSESTIFSMSGTAELVVCFTPES